MPITNLLEVNACVALKPSDRLEVRSVVCPHLPWLDRDTIVWPSVRTALEEPLQQAVTQLLTIGQSAVLEKAIATASSALGELLLREFRIAAGVRLTVHIEEQAEGVGEAILSRLTEKERESTGQLLNNGQISWKPFDEIAEAQSIQLSQKDVTVENGSVALIPGTRNRVLLRTKRGFFLGGLRFFGNPCLGEVEESRAISEGSTLVTLPEIAVAEYACLNRTAGRVELECLVGSAGRAVGPVKVNVSVPPLKHPPVAVFVDMGSTMTKLLVVELTTSPLPDTPSDGGWLEQLRRDLHQADSEKGRADRIASIEPPKATADFISERGLPAFDKAALDKLPAEALVSWFESAIRALAGFVACSKMRLISHVFWSFPDTRKRDFTALNEELNRRVGRVVLDRIEIVPEHHCLRRNFGGVLHFLASKAQAQHRDRTDAQKHNKSIENQKSEADATFSKEQKAYGKKSWFVRLFHSAPEAPDTSKLRQVQVPTLDEWHKQFRHINAAETLDEMVVIDAGGYSLDVFAHTESGMPLARSFAVGGSMLTSRLRRFLADERGVALEDLPWNETEERKCRICDYDEPEEHRPAFRRCRELTAEIYDPALHEMADWIAPQSASRGIPVVLTGGGMGNRFLRERIRDILRDHGVRSHATDTVELSGLLAKNTTSMEAQQFALFNAIPREFGDRSPVPWYDILGGLTQHAATDE